MTAGMWMRMCQKNSSNKIWSVLWRRDESVGIRLSTGRNLPPPPTCQRFKLNTITVCSVVWLSQDENNLPYKANNMQTSTCFSQAHLWGVFLGIACSTCKELDFYHCWVASVCRTKHQWPWYHLNFIVCQATAIQCLVLSLWLLVLI